MLGIRGRIEDLVRFVALGLVNPFEPESRKRWGIAPDRAMALALGTDGSSLVVTVDDAATAAALLEALATARRPV